MRAFGDHKLRAGSADADTRLLRGADLEGNIRAVHGPVEIIRLQVKET